MNVKISMNNIMKIVNIFFLMVLENFIMDSGMGVFGISFLVMMTLYTILFSGLQNGIAKIVSLRISKGITNNSRQVLQPSVIYVFATGLCIVLLGLFCGKGFCAKVFGTGYPYSVFLLFCIMVLINGITDVLCGYQNGNGNGIVINAVNLSRMLFPVLLIFPIYSFFHKYGQKVASLLKNTSVVSAYSALGLACVYVISSVMILFIAIIFIIRLRAHNEEGRNVRTLDVKKIGYGSILYTSFRVGFNQLFPILSVTTVVCLYLVYGIRSGMDMEDLYSNIGIGFSKLLLPIAFVLTIFSEYISREKHRLHVDLKKEEYKTGTTRVQYMIKNSFFMLLPPTMILTFLAEPFVKVFFYGQDILSAKVLQTGGFLLLFAGVAHAINSVLKALNKDIFALGFQGISLVVQVLFLWTMLSKTNGSTMVMVYSFYCYFSIQILLGGAILLRSMKLDTMDLLIKIGKYGIASIVMMILFLILDKFIMMNVLLILLSMFLGYLLYYLTIFALKGISQKDEQALKRTLNYYPVSFLRSRLRL